MGFRDVRLGRVEQTLRSASSGRKKNRFSPLRSLTSAAEGRSFADRLNAGLKARTTRATATSELLCNRWMQGSDETFKFELARSGAGASRKQIVQRRCNGNLLQRLDEAAYDLFSASALGGHRAPRVRIDNDTRSAEVGAYHRDAVRHGFQNRHAPRISQAGEQEHVRGAIVVLHPVVRDPADPFHDFGEP